MLFCLGAGDKTKPKTEQKARQNKNKSQETKQETKKPPNTQLPDYLSTHYI